ncbi:hypothetical protein KBB96_16320 [Luteolibacter ambystomatis]|uniref:DUF6985 domain-containing protein n=1 Tax=Luteolibacter ambystomatis TaxID=2824561 RepID=A0A975G7X6_9BACT|nr:hypothetical protein [Luteolibacter ambystomatis]QUE50421.1 hypothetical protein KBB96_16320 [Luteolibacter ambystomatis]
MNVPLLGRLRPEPDGSGWMACAPISVPLYEGLDLDANIEGIDEADAGEANAALQAFLALGTDGRREAQPYVYQHYLRIAKLFGDQLECHIDSPDDVWQHIHPCSLTLTKREEDDLIYVQICGGCDWDAEHGLQMIYRRGRQLSRVSGYDGHLTHSDAHGLTEDQDRIV